MTHRVRDVLAALASCAALLASVACGSDTGDEVRPGAGPAADQGSSPGALDAPPSSSSARPPPAPAAHDTGAALPDAESPPPTFTVTDEAITVSGLARSYVLVLPRDYDAARRYPLVVAMHGDGGDGASMRAGFPVEEASGASAIVVYPSGRNHTWDLYAPADTDVDVAFLEALIASLAARWSIDPARVFATGFSSGAFMANQMACRRPALFRAIASHGGGAPSEPRDPAASTWEGTGFTRCAGQTSGVAALVVHGEEDGVVSWESGSYTATYWSTVNGCGTARVPAGGLLGALGCERWQGCPATTPVTMCSVDGLGHTVWSEAAKATWAFFAGF